MCKTQEKMLSTLLLYKKIVRAITNTLMRQNSHYVCSHIFLEYLHYRLQRISKQNLCWITLPDAALKCILDNFENTQNEYIDYDCCALGNIQFLKKSSWCHVCSIISMTKYKLLITSMSDTSENTILISETMRHNLQNVLYCEQFDESCFIRKYIFSIYHSIFYI